MNIPFAIYLLPGEDELHFCASEKTCHVSVRQFFDASDNGSFAIAPFIPSETIEIISPELSPGAVLALEQTGSIEPNVDSPVETTFGDYSVTGKKVINQLVENGGKVVLSRVIVEKGTNPVSVAVEYFNALPSTFRSLFYTPEKGLWLGATPEVLASYSSKDNTLTTMSLAGTRTAGTSGKWDSKNIEEHNFVTDFIKDILMPNSDKVTISDMYPVKFGAVEHLCEKIIATGIKDISSIIAGLSPTPAVCGTPRDFAFQAISQAESHSRECYGGWLGVKLEKVTEVFVNLRCSKIIPSSSGGEYIYNVYAGGGFTDKSIIEEEWNEAGQKASILLEIIKASRLDGE
ncbi:MAG: chorismate-binding protein [Paramuribaculum sp.]|nr:chorismate-binding protein [Paramuribaculum sp.]